MGRVPTWRTSYTHRQLLQPHQAPSQTTNSPRKVHLTSHPLAPTHPHPHTPTHTSTPHLQLLQRVGLQRHLLPQPVWGEKNAGGGVGLVG